MAEEPSTAARTLGRRRVLQAAAVVSAVQVASPYLIAARGEVPVRIGMVDPITGVYAAVAVDEVDGAKLAVAQINKKGGVLGRQLDLLVEDSANDVGTGVQKTRKLLSRDKADVILGDVNSGIAYAMTQVTGDARVLHIVPGGHTDPITGKDCRWNVFRVCNTTAMDVTAITQTLVSKYGKKWFFVTPDYAYGHSVQANFERRLKGLGGTWDGDLLPIGTQDYSATLIRAKSYGPNVLLDVMGGGDQVNSIKQFVQFGLQRDMALGGTLFELESVLAVPENARIGWWTMEWWWNQPGVPAVADFIAATKAASNKMPSARNWMGYVAVHAVALAAEKARSLDGVALAHALEDLVLPPEVALMEGQIRFRRGDHQLMSNVFMGEVHAAQGDPNNVFTIHETLGGEAASGPVADTGCHITYPTG